MEERKRGVKGKERIIVEDTKMFKKRQSQIAHGDISRHEGQALGIKKTPEESDKGDVIS